MKLCKINLKEIISFAFMMGIICFFKTIYINSITYTSYSDLVSNILIFWNKNQFVNLIWFLPVLMNLFFVSKKYYEKLVVFNPRYGNRYNYVSYVIRDCFIYSFAYNLIVALSEIIFITLFIKASYYFSFELIKNVLLYVLINIFLDFVTLYLCLLINKYMYSFLIVISICIMFLVVSNNFTLSFLKTYFIIYVLVIIILVIYLIKGKYQKIDIGGLERDIRN